MSTRYLGHRVGQIEATYQVEAPVETAWEVFSRFDEMSLYVPRLLYSKRLGLLPALEIIKSQPKEFEEAMAIVQKYSMRPDEPTIATTATPRVLYILQRFDFPWPLSNQWTLSESLEEIDPSGPVFQLSRQSVAGSLTDEKGRWTFRPSPLNPEGTEIYYLAISDPGFWIPPIIFNPSAKATTRQMMNAIRKRIEATR